MTLLEVRDLTKRFRGPGGDHLAVDGLGFDMAPKTTVALVGESGAGKSTAGQLVLRLIEPDSGSVRLDGVDLLALGPKELRLARRDMQMVFQDPYTALDPRFTIGRSVAEPLRVLSGMNRTDREARVAALLDRVGLTPAMAARYPHELSGGQLQRVSIARALALDPKLIVCDEALSALDMSIQAQVLNLLLELQDERGLGYLFISHDLSLVESIADQVIVMRHGRSVEQGPAEAIFRSPRDEYTRELLAAVPVPDPRERRRRRGVDAASA